MSELAESCNFGTDKEEQIKDASVIDIADKEVSLELQMDSELTPRKKYSNSSWLSAYWGAKYRSGNSRGSCWWSVSI